MCLCKLANLSYLLVDQDVLVSFSVLLWKILLHLPETGSLFEKLPIYGKLLSFGDFPPLDECHDLS